MPKFAVGQLVYHTSGKHSGRVVEVEGDSVYFVQANGVEMDFRTAELTTVAPPAQKSRVSAEPVNMTRTLTMNDITPEHQRVLAIIPQRTMQTVASLFERKKGAGRFSALDVAQKLNYITEVTAVPYRTMKEFSDQPGTLSLMMGRGLSISSGSAT